jgi:ABC-type Fe3+-citrate transport system substrate-binding protein
VAPDAYSYALVAEIGMLCGACNEAKHLYWEARRQFAHQARLLDDLETKLWKVWSHKELSEIYERVRNDHVCVCVCVTKCIKKNNKLKIQVWSQKELWGIYESVRNDHKLLVDSHAWASLSAALHDAAANGTLLGGGFMDEGARAGYTMTRLVSRCLKVG